MVVCLLTASSLQAQFSFSYDGPTTLYLNENCQAEVDFMGQPPVLSSIDGANIVPPSGLNPANPFMPGDTVQGVQTVVFQYLAADDQGNSDTFSFSISFVDTIPPQFVLPPPADTTLLCLEDAPAPFFFEVTDNCAGSFLVQAVDNPSIPATVCGAPVVVTRSWTAVDPSGNVTIQTQTITFLPDTIAPTISFQPISETVNCNMASFPTWLNVQRQIILQGAMDNCGADNLTLSDDAPVSFDVACGAVTVNFVLEDLCGLADTASATFTIIDTIAPVLVGVPADTVLSCEDAIPAPPVVTATDNCDAGPLTVSYEETSDATNDGSCSDFTYTIIRTWSTIDECGNKISAVQHIQVQDTVPPTFTVPADTVLACGMPTDTSVTGGVLILLASDNCDTNLVINFVDVTDTLTCPNHYEIQRTWSVADVCGNTATGIQLITVIDTVPPTFDPPVDSLMVACEDVGDITVSGMPTNVVDACGGEVLVYRVDLFETGPCQGTYSIERVWYVEDACGNVDSFIQILLVEDGEAPAFTENPVDLELNCTELSNLDSLFTDWIQNFGGGEGSDNCLPDSLLFRQIYLSGTTLPASLAMPVCPSSEQGIYLFQEFDFVLIDQCGNMALQTAALRVFDTEAPDIVLCPADTTVQTDAGLCSALFTLEPPVASDACGADVFPQVYAQNQPIVTAGPLGQEENFPVEPVVFQIVLQPGATFATGNVGFEILMPSVDAEGPEAFFFVVGEDGTVLGQTNPSTAECDTSLTLFSIPQALFNVWAADGVLTLTMEPNTPASVPVEELINAICPNSDAQLYMSYEASQVSNLRWQYRINGADPVQADSLSPVVVELPEGVNDIEYLVLDCAGNQSSCSFEVLVVDSEPPVAVCPSSFTVATESTACSAEVEIPLLLSIADNCGVGNLILQEQPAVNNDAFISFTFNTASNNYVAEDKSITFTGLSPTAVNDVNIRVEIRADVNNLGEYFTIRDELGQVLAVTELGQPNVSPGNCVVAQVTQITMPASSFNEQVVDGMLSLIAESNLDFTGLPGSADLGINPCNPAAVMQNGDVDGLSTFRMFLEYTSYQPTYFAEGATNIAPTVLTDLSVPPVHTFNLGETSVFYVVEDASGNADTCSFDITVVDQTLPTALCEPTIIFINPSGVQPETIAPTTIDAGSFDNCVIDSMYVLPNLVNCNLIGDSINVTLFVVDDSGNTGSCVTSVRIEGLPPMPTYAAGTCGGDTLKLFANPPTAPGSVFTYTWTGPNGFFSTQQNPLIPNATSANAGTYIVTISGITGCTAVGEVQVSITDLPITPILSFASNSICSENNIVLQTTPVSGSGSLQYQWYSGNLSGGVFLGTTISPSFTIPGPHVEGTYCYYVVVVQNGCASFPSASSCLSVTQTPTAITNDAVIDLCSGETIQLGSPVSGPGLQYTWSGPNGYMSSSQNPPVIPNASSANSGVYTLLISKNGCVSPVPGTTVVNVLPKPNTPLLSNTTTQSTPACVGDTVTLVANLSGATTYVWTSPLFNQFQTTTNTLVLNSVTLAQAGGWTVYAIDGICESDVSNPSTVYIESLPNAQAISNSPLCSNVSLQLNATPIPGAIYNWTTPSMANLPGQQQTLPPVPGLYTLTVTSPSGCTNTDELTVVVNQAPSITSVSNNAPLCPDAPFPLQLTATVIPLDGLYTYQWTGPNGYQSSAVSPIINNATAANNGSYQLVITDANGCSSAPQSTVVAMGPILAKPSTPIVSAGAPLCENGSMTLSTQDLYNGLVETYYWHTPNGMFQTTTPTLTLSPLAVMDSGPYLVQVEVDGCFTDSSNVLMITVNPKPVIEAASNSPVCQGEEIQLFVLDCIPGASYAWNGPSGISSSLCNPVIPSASLITHPGTYTVVVTSNGCASNPVSTQVQVNPLPTKPAIVHNGPICISDDDAELVLSVTPPTTTPGASYSWFVDGVPVGATSTAPSLAIDDFSAFSNGTYQFTVIATQNNCSSPVSNSTSITLNTIPANNAVAGANIQVCESEPAQLNATAPNIGTGLWTLVSGPAQGVAIANPNAASTTVSGMTPGNLYTFQWTLSNGACIDYSSDQMTVLVDVQESADAGVNIDTCGVTSVTLNGVVPQVGGGVWTQPTQQQLLNVNILQPSNPNSAITGLVPGNSYLFTWTLTDNGCGSSSDVVMVRVFDAQAQVGGDYSDCGEGCTVLNASQPDFGFGTWSSSNPDVVFSNATDAKAEACNLVPGPNVFFWTLNNGICGAQGTDSVVVNYRFAPLAEDDVVVVEFASEQTFNVVDNDEHPGSFFVNVLTQPAQGQLTDLGNGNFRYRANINYIGEDEFVYELCSDGCDCSTARVQFSVGDGANCDIPTIFTPNGDGINDRFVVPCLADEGEYPGNNLSIFNQWGDEVYRAAPYQNNWEGTHQGSPLPPGTYFFILDLGDGNKPQSGFVVIQF
jgi:gliding motility-associated-like protein